LAQLITAPILNPNWNEVYVWVYWCWTLLLRCWYRVSHINSYLILLCIRCLLGMFVVVWLKHKLWAWNSCSYLCTSALIWIVIKIISYNQCVTYQQYTLIHDRHGHCVKYIYWSVIKDWRGTDNIGHTGSKLEKCIGGRLIVHPEW